MNKSLPIMCIIHKSLPSIQPNLAKTSKILTEKSLTNETGAIN